MLASSASSGSILLLEEQLPCAGNCCLLNMPVVTVVLIIAQLPMQQLKNLDYEHNHYGTDRFRKALF